MRCRSVLRPTLPRCTVVLPVPRLPCHVSRCLRLYGAHPHTRCRLRCGFYQFAHVLDDFVRFTRCVGMVFHDYILRLYDHSVVVLNLRAVI